MALDPWYKVALPREEVREGRSFNPDEFAIALEQVVAGTAPVDYRDPESFFVRTCFTRALREHAGMVLRRLAGKTANTSPVMTLVTQFGGGKTHTLTALYHLVTAGKTVGRLAEVTDLLHDAGLSAAPEARVAVFVGNAWDPRKGREAPWIDVARQLAGDRGVEQLGASAATTPPGTEALGRVFAAAGAPVLVLFDEVLNFVNRYRKLADPFHAFIQNLTVAMTGTTHGAAVISLPRSHVEMSDFDMAWQDKITKVVRRVAKDLLANDETEVSEVVRRRLFDAIGASGSPSGRAPAARRPGSIRARSSGPSGSRAANCGTRWSSGSPGSASTPRFRRAPSEASSTAPSSRTSARRSGKPATRLVRRCGATTASW